MIHEYIKIYVYTSTCPGISMVYVINAKCKSEQRKVGDKRN